MEDSGREMLRSFAGLPLAVKSVEGFGGGYQKEIFYILSKHD